MTVDWDRLRAAATDAAQRAYAPYSELHVGAAGLTGEGEVVVGCNVENASYGLTLCAECVMVGNQRLAGAARLVAVVCVDDAGALLTPCGRCRQLLLEAGGPTLVVLTADGPATIADLLPGAFSGADLP